MMILKHFSSTDDWILTVPFLETFFNVLEISDWNTGCTYTGNALLV